MPHGNGCAVHFQRGSAGRPPTVISWMLHWSAASAVTTARTAVSRCAANRNRSCHVGANSGTNPVQRTLRIAVPYADSYPTTIWRDVYASGIDVRQNTVAPSGV